MSENKFLKCTCAQCGGHIEFPADGIGMTIPCPHCGWQTELTLAAPEQTSAKPPRSLKWVIAGVVILIIGVAGVATALVMAQKLVSKAPRDQRAVAQTRRIVPKNAVGVSSGQLPFTAAVTTNGLSVSAVAMEKRPGSTLIYAIGTVKNETDKQRFGVNVEIDLFDGSGQKIGSAKDYKDALEAGATWAFRALVVSKNAASARVVSVTEQQ